MDNNNESSELMSTNSSIQENGTQSVANFYVNWEPDRSRSGYQVSFGRSYGDRGDSLYRVLIGEDAPYARLPNGKTGTLSHEAIPNEPKKLGKLSLKIDNEKYQVNYRD